MNAKDNSSKHSKALSPSDTTEQDSNKEQIDSKSSSNDRPEHDALIRKFKYLFTVIIMSKYGIFGHYDDKL